MKRITYVFFSTVIVFGTIFFSIPTTRAAFGDVTTFVGQIYDGDGGDRSDAYFDFPEDLDISSSGNFYIADTYNNVIRKINTSGVVSTLAGTGSYGDTTGSPTASEFALPRGVSVGSDGAVYVADTANNKIKKIKGSTVSTLVSSGLSGPEGVEVYGSRVYIADTGNNAIKYVSTSGGTLHTISDDLNKPKKLVANAGGSLLYVADSGSYRVLSVNTSSGNVSVIAGSGVQGYEEGVGTAAQFNNVWGVALDGSTLFVSDGDGLTDFIRKIDLTTRETTLFAEDGSMASINFPTGLKVYNGYVYVANEGIGTIHRFRITLSGDEETFAGYERFGNRNGSADEALFGRPYDLVMTADRQYIYVADNNKIRRITRATGAVSHVIGHSVDNYREGDDNPLHYKGPVRFSTIQSLTVNSSGTRLYVADRWNNRIRGVNLEADLPYSYLVTGAGLINTTGTSNNGYREGTKCADEFDTGMAGCAYFRGPGGIVIDPTNTYLYVSDTGNNRIRKVRISDGQTWLVAGSGQAGYANGVGSAAKFNAPIGITIDSTGSNLYVADSNNHAIRRINLSNNEATTLAGSGVAGYREAVGTRAVLSFPGYVKMGADGNLYFSDSGSHRIRMVNPQTGLTKLVAGAGTRGFKNGAKTVAEFNSARGLAPDSAADTLYIADTWNDMIRKIDITGVADFTEPAPTVTAVSPAEVNPAWDKGSGLNVRVEGTNFSFGAEIYFGDIKNAKTYAQSGTYSVVQLPLSQMSAGWYDVSVINMDGQHTTLERGLGITDSSGVTPATYHEYSNKSGGTSGSTSENIAPGTTFFVYDQNLRGGYRVAAGNVRGDGNAEIITGTGNGMAPQVRVFDNSGTLLSQFFAYDSSLRHGVSVSACDVDADGYEEIVTAPGRGGLPLVKIFNSEGEAAGDGFYVLDGKFTGGVNLSCGDTNGDGTYEIVVAAQPGGGPHVLVYNLNGRIMTNFMAYDPGFRGGINVGTIDMDGNGKDEIVTGPQVGAPHVQIFQIRPNELKRLSPGFYAFNADYRGGVSVAGVDTNGDGTKELVVGVGDNATPFVKVYNIREELQKEFYAYATNFLGGVNLGGGDVDGDGADELLVIPRGGGGPQVKIINVDEI